MQNYTIFPISFFSSKLDNVPKVKDSSFLINLIKNPPIRIGAKKGATGAFSPVKFNGTRSNENAIELYALVLDYDSKESEGKVKIKQNFDEEIKFFESLGFTFFTHTTFSHTKDNHCFRVILPLKEPIPNSEYSKLWYWAYKITENKTDKSCKDIHRLSYLPIVHNQDAPYWKYFFEGTLLDWKNLPLVMENEVKQEQDKVNHKQTKSNHTQTILDNDPIWKYIKKLPFSIAGSHGHDKLYKCACALIQGFGLSKVAAMPYFQHWNKLKAKPPESDYQLNHKLSDAEKEPLPEGKKRGWLKLDLKKKNKDTSAKDPNLKEHKLDDLDFAIEFTNSYPDIKFDEKNNVWRQWSNTHWKEIESTGFIKEIIHNLVRDNSPTTFISSKKVDSIYKLLQTEATTIFEQKDNLLNFLNITLNILTNEHYNHNREDYLTSCFAYDYPTAWPHENSVDNILKFLETTFQNDELAINDFVTHLGLSLMRDTKFHKSMILIGKPGSGKTTAIVLANLVCGLSKVTAYTFASSSLFDRASEGYRARATWNNKPLVCVDELPVEAFRNEEILKCMVAHSGVGMRQMYKKEETNNRWLPKLIFTTNDSPTIKDFSGAIRRRLIILDCPNTVEQQDINFIDTLLPELGAFAFACLEFARQALECGYYPGNDTHAAKVEEISELSNPIKQFVKDCCLVDKDSWESSKAIHNAYKQFCEEENIKQPSNNGWLMRRLVDMGFKTQTKNNIRGAQGIKLKPRADYNPSDFDRRFAERAKIKLDD